MTSEATVPSITLPKEDVGVKRDSMTGLTPRQGGKKARTNEKHGTCLGVVDGVIGFLSSDTLRRCHYDLV